MTQYCGNCGIAQTPENTSTMGKVRALRYFCRACRQSIWRATGREASFKVKSAMTTLDTWTPQIESLMSAPKTLENARTVYLDIETSGISKSEYTKVLSYALMDAETGAIYTDALTKADIDNDIDVEDHIIRADTRLLMHLVQDLQRYNRVVTWFGKGFDVPTLRTRCSLLGISFPAPWDLVHEDLYYTSKRKYRFTSNRLGAVAEAYGCTDKKTAVTPKAWDLAARGDERAITYVLEHNIIDVKLLAFVDGKFKGQHKEIRSQF